MSHNNYREPSLGEWAGETLYALAMLLLFGAPWLVVGLAICLVVWIIQLIVRAITRKRPTPDERSVWDRLEE